MNSFLYLDIIVILYKRNYCFSVCKNRFFVL